MKTMATRCPRWVREGLWVTPFSIVFCMLIAGIIGWAIALDERGGAPAAPVFVGSEPVVTELFTDVSCAFVTVPVYGDSGALLREIPVTVCLEVDE